MNQIFVSNAPWIIGRPALFEYALEDFLGELGRQRPWTRARFQELLEDFNLWLDSQLNFPVSLEQVSIELVQGWFETLAIHNRSDARQALEMFAEYLVSWGWLESCSWLLVSDVQR